MRQLSVWVLFLFILFPVEAKQIFTLPEVVKPFRVNVDDRHIFIGDGPAIFIFSREDGRLIKKFGKAGEGPREFKLFPEFSPELDIRPDGILVNSLGKISFFSNSGDFKWEKKSPGYVLEHFNRLWGDQIVGQRVERDAETLYLVEKLYDLNFGNEREFHRHKYYLQQGKHNPIQRGIYISNFYIQDGQVFVGGAIDSGTIHVYDLKGRHIRNIKPSFDRVPFTAKDRQGWIDSYMSNDEYKQLYERRKKWFDYPEFFPLFQNFIVADGRIYIQTYKRNDKQGTNEVLVLDLNGKLIKKVWIPLVEFWDFSPNPYSIENSKLFQVVENSDTEEWELHITPIK
jgi:hypothetical protein